MSLVAKALDDAQQAEMAAVTDRMLAESLSALCQVMDCEDAQMANGPAVAGTLAMLATLCKDLVPTEMPRDFPVVEIFGALARDPEFEPLATETVGEMAFEVYLAEPPVYRAELVPALMPPRASTTEAAFARRNASEVVATGAPLSLSQATELARLLRVLAPLTGLPLGMLSPLLFTAIACKDMYEVYKATDSVERAARSLLKDGRNVTNIVLAVTQIATSVFVASNESNPLTYLARPLWLTMDKRLNGPQWMAYHPSATTILDALQNRQLDVAKLPTLIAQGISTDAFGAAQASDLGFWADRLWNGRTASTDMGKLLNWINTVKNAPMGPLGLANKYREAEYLGLAATAISALINASQLTPTFQEIRDRLQGGNAEDRLAGFRDVVDKLGDEMPDDDDMARDAAVDQSRIEVYKRNIQLAANRGTIDADRLLPLMRSLAAIRRESKGYDWSVRDAGKQAALEAVITEFDDLATEFGHDWNFGAPCLVAPSASVVDALFQGRA